MAETKPAGAKKHITGARIAQEIKQYKKDALISPMYTVCCVILEILIPYLTASIIDKGIAVGNMAHVAKIGALMAVMAILAMFFGVRAGVHSARASTGLASNLRESMFGRIQAYSFSNIDRFSTAGLVTRLTTDVTNIQNAFQMILQICTRAPVTLIVALFMAFSINAKLSLVFLVAMAFLGVMIVVLIPKAMQYFKLMFRKYDAVNGVVQENVGAIRVVKAFVREDYEDEKFSGAANALFKNSISAELYRREDDCCQFADNRRADESAGLLYEHPDEPDDALHGLCHGHAVRRGGAAHRGGARGAAGYHQPGKRGQDREGRLR